MRAWLIGAPKNLLDPRIHHSLALVAFFAWVGLGSDGLSSSSYGPEQVPPNLGATSTSRSTWRWRRRRRSS
jgi:hypothetical protein